MDFTASPQGYHANKISIPILNVKYAIAVDIGATKLRVALGNERGRILSKLAERTDASSKLSIARQIIRLAKRLLGQRKAEGIGIGSIGPLDLKKGAILNTPNLPLSNIPLVKPIEAELGLPVTLLNDCNAAVLGESEFGLGRGLENLAYITLSTGIGGGAIVDGKLLLGKDGNAVEIGHLVVDERGRLRCGCGRPGHWEAYCSGANLPKFARLWLRENPMRSVLFELAGTELAKLSSSMLFKAAKLGDEASIRIVGEVGRLNAIGFANVINAYDPDLITVGGAIALQNRRLVLGPIRQRVKDYAINRVPRIAPTQFGEDVVLYGALASVFRGI